MRFVRRDPNIGYLDSALWAPKSALNVEGVKNALTFMLTDKMGGARYLQLYRETEHHLIVPRAMWDLNDVGFEVVDCRPAYFQKVSIISRITLDAKNPSSTTQKDAAEAILRARGGILQLACGKGKSVVALYVASIMSVPTLIVVNNTNLMKQWQGEISKHLEVPDGVGLIQGDVCDWKKPIVLSTYQTLANRADDLPEELRRHFGLGIFDEGHHAAAPWFCRSIDLIYGYRLLLTATPERTDGAHVIYNFHAGPVLYKDLRQELTPHFQFLWTGLQLDMNDERVKEEVTDKNGELHLSKLAGHFGRWRQRLEFILKEVRKHEAAGRKILVLSNSIGELVNLLALYNGRTDLYTDIPVPQPSEFGSSLVPVPLTKKARARRELELKRAKAALFDRRLNQIQRDNLKHKVIPLIEEKLAQDDLASQIRRELERRQRAYIKEVAAMPSTAGLMIAKIPADERMKALRSKITNFAIYQYGLEGLDEADLDTIIAAEPMTSKNALQQFIGRTLRVGNKIGKKPLVQFLEDDIGPILGMCKVIRRQLRQWPVDEGGPYEYELIDHPNTIRRLQWLNSKRKRFGSAFFPPPGGTTGA
jgi:superfamily II DNA or RNA helicase